MSVIPSRTERLLIVITKIVLDRPALLLPHTSPRPADTEQSFQSRPLLFLQGGAGLDVMVSHNQTDVAPGHNTLNTYGVFGIRMMQHFLDYINIKKEQNVGSKCGWKRNSNLNFFYERKFGRNR